MRDWLRESGLFLQGTEYFSCHGRVSSYYGFNVTKTDREPIDQVHAFLAARRIQDGCESSRSGRGRFHAFVAGAFEVLNATSAEETAQILSTNLPKEQRKRQLFECLANYLRLDCSVWTTFDLWRDPRYWAIVEDLLAAQKAFTKGQLVQDTLKWYQGDRSRLEAVIRIRELPSESFPISEGLRKRIWDWPASILYTPLEVAEARYFRDVHEVCVKIGHMDERIYDKYIMEVMDVVHLRQPSDFKARRLKPRGVTPYIDKDRERDPKVRIFFGDTADAIRGRLAACAIEDYVWTLDPELGEMLNPWIDKFVYAVETSVLAGDGLTVDGVQLEGGDDLIRRVAVGEITFEEIQATMPDVIYEHLLAPVQSCGVGK